MSLEAIERLLSQKIGIASSIIGIRKITKAAEIRCSVHGLSDLGAYFNLLQTLPQEFEELVEQIVVPETYFFRDRKPFEFLIEYAQTHWLSRVSKVRLLSAPCSTGEEPYSIAISLLEAGLPAHQFSVDAIDISKVAIAKAHRAIYGKNSFRGEPGIDAAQYFEQTKEGYEVKAAVRSLVHFRQGNLLTALSTAQAQYDVIFCRNLLIYLEPSACNLLFNSFHQLLLPKGLLFVGASETNKIPSDLFSSLRQPFTFCYQKNEVAQLLQPEVKPVEKKTQSKTYTFFSKIEQKRTFQGKAKDTPNSSPSQETVVPATKFELAKQLADAGDVEAAIDYCKIHLECDSVNADVYTLLGTLHQAKAKNSEAEKYFRKALYLDPVHYEALVHLALLKEHQGDVMGAKILQQRIEKLQQSF